MEDTIIQLTDKERQSLKTIINLIDNLEIKLNHAEVEIRDKEDKHHFSYPQSRDLSDYNVFLRELFYGEIVIFDNEEDEE